MRRRSRMVLAWIAEPWRSAAVFVPLVLAFALPAVFLSVADRFEQAASDVIAQRTVSGLLPADQGLTITANGVLTGEEARVADQAITELLADANTLMPPVRTAFTPRGSLVSPGTAELESSRIVGSTQLFSRPGAIESLALIDVDDDLLGVYISELVAAEGALSVGSTVEIAIGDEARILTIKGIYEDLWPEPPVYWDDVPTQLVPKFSRVFGSTIHELVIVEESLLSQLEMTGVLRWDAVPVSSPATLEELEALVTSYRGIERSIVSDPVVGAQLRNFARGEASTPSVRSSASQALTSTYRSLNALDRPLQSSRVAGVALALLIVAANAAFVASQRTITWRTLVDGGDGGFRFLSLGVGEAVIPAALGGTLGLLASAPLTTPLVPDRDAGFESIDVTSVFAATVAAVAVSAITTATLALRLGTRTDVKPIRYTALLLPLCGVAAAAWIQVGASSARGSLSLLVIAAPIVILAAATGVVMVVVGALVRGLSRRLNTRWQPVSVLLGIRRVAGRVIGPSVAVGALAISVGLANYSLVLRETREQASEAKIATVIGAESRATLRGAFEEPQDRPADTTMIRTKWMRAFPGDVRVQVIAIEADTFADVIRWPDSFGDLTASQVVDRLGLDLGGPVPAMWVTPRAVPGVGAIGFEETFPYQIVGTLESAPLIDGPRPVLLIRSDELERAGRTRFASVHETDTGFAPTAQDFEDEYVSPLLGFGRKLVGGMSVEELRLALDDVDAGYRDLVGRDEIDNAAAEQATRWSFSYWVFVAAVCGLASLLALALFVHQRRLSGRLAGRVSRELGVSQAMSFGAALIEFVTYAVIAAVAGVVGAIVLARHVAPIFETNSEVPPRIDLVVPWATVGVVGVVTIAVIVVVGVRFETRTIGGP